MGRKLGETRVAVIGLGPRGLGATEALARHASAGGLPVAVEVFDPVTAPGAGPNFGPAESRLCLLNLPVRDISIGGLNFGEVDVPDFRDRLTGAANPDSYVARAELGAYFAARFDALMAGATPGLSLRRHMLSVHGLESESGGWMLRTTAGEHGPYDEVLLALGQPDTEPDEQLARWQAHALTHDCDLVPAYPTQALLDAAEGWAGKSVAIRGLGLSTLDVLRLLTLGLGGRFADGAYRPSGREPGLILPFSLDGQPPAPKPADEAVDRTFTPLEPETRAFERVLAESAGHGPDALLDEITQVLTRPAERILRDIDPSHVSGKVQAWLETERESPGAQETSEPFEALVATIAMAEGERPPSTGYVIGQVWRKWQEILRSHFDEAPPEPETASALVGFDEGLKRYSYGPPVGNARELKMLIESGLVELRAAEDPKVRLVDDGWELTEGDARARVSAMIDAVLPSPAIGSTRDPLTVALKEAGIICPRDEGMGARTGPDGRVIREDGTEAHGLSMLGRLTLGSVIAADSIHDCFGPVTENWAASVVRRASGNDRS